MNTIEKKREEYLETKAKIDDTNQAVREKQAEIETLDALLIETQKSINELYEKLKPQDPTMIPFGVYKETPPISYEETLTLKQVFSDKENELSALVDKKKHLDYQLNFHNGMLPTGRRILNEQRKRIAGDLSAQTADEITGAVGEQLKKWVNELQVSTSSNKDIYRIIGVELCQRIFGEKGADSANLPDIFDSKQLVDELIVKLP